MKKKTHGTHPADYLADPSLGVEARTAYRFSVLCTLNMRCLSDLYATKFKLSMAGWRVLSIVGRYERVFPSVVAELTTIEADKVTRAVDRLVEMGLALRTTDSSDRRRVILSLSASGQAVYAEIEAAARAMEAELCSVLTEEEWTGLSATLDKLAAHGKQIFADKDAWMDFAAGARFASYERRYAEAPPAPRKSKTM